MATITNTKLSQGQIKGNGKAHLNEEMLAVESAIAGALGKGTFEGGADISLKDLGEMVDGDGIAGMTLKVDVAADGFDITGAGEMSASVSTFSTTHAGVLDASSSAISGNETVGGNLTVTGLAGAGSLVVQGTGQVKGNMTVGDGVEGTGDLIVWGDLTVKGDTVTLDTTTLQVEDDKIVMSKGFPDKVGAGFALGSDAGTHSMVWGGAKWMISDGVVSADFKAGSKVTVNSFGVETAMGDNLALKSGESLLFADKFNAASALDFSKAGEYDAIFDAVNGWAVGTEGLLGLFTKVKGDAASELLSVSGSLAAAIDAEEARALAAEGVLQSNIDAEASARAAADLAHDAAISSEEAARIAADTALQADIDAEEAARIAAVSAEEAARIAAVSAEEAARIAGDAALQAGLDAEIARATAAETVLTTDLAAEVARATAAEAALQVEIDAEEVRAAAAEAALQADIDAEEVRALAAEAALQADIDAEEAARIAAVSAEAATRAAADTALQVSLDAEIARATAAEVAIAADLATETARALAAEAVLQGNIDTLSASIVAQAYKVWSAVVPAGGILADNNVADLVGRTASKTGAAYDVFLNGQKMAFSSEWNLVLGQVQFKFAVSENDLVFVREN